MKFRIINDFDWPVDKIKGVISTGEDLVPPEKLQNVQARNVIEFKRDGDNFFRRCEWCVHGQIPKVAQKIVSPDMLKFTEDTKWDNQSGAFTTKISPHFLKDNLSMSSISRWTAKGSNACIREYEGSLDIRIPILGPLLEKTIIDHLKKNTEQNAVMVRKALETRFGPPAR